MDYVITEHEAINCLRTSIAGEYKYLDALRFFDLLITQCTKKKYDAVLIDVRNLSGRIDTMQVYQFGELVSSNRKVLNKIAILCCKEQFKDDFFKTVLRNRGILCKATDKEEEAISWMVKKSSL
jgi:hypothetical protein